MGGWGALIGVCYDLKVERFLFGFFPKTGDHNNCCAGDTKDSSALKNQIFYLFHGLPEIQSQICQP